MQKNFLKNNYTKYLIITILNSTACLFATGSLVQTFMIAKGISNDLVAIYPSIIQIVQTAIMILCSFVCDRFRKIKRVIVFATLILPTLFAGFLIAELPSILSNTAYVIILITSIITNIGLGIYNIFIYKLPYSVINMEDYGKLASVAGIISNIISISLTSLISLLVNFIDFFIVMFVTFTIGIILWVISAIITSSLKEKNQDTVVDIKPESIGTQSLIKYPFFYKLIPANILRGVSMGIITQIVLIGTFAKLLNTNLAVIITAITCAASVAGSIVYIFLEKKIKSGTILLVSAIVMSLSMPITTLFGVVPLFVFYFITYMANQIVSLGIPVIIYKYVTYGLIGRYTAWRMMFFTLGCALPGFFIDPLLNLAGEIVVLSIGAACMLMACLMYMLVFRKAPLLESNK